MLTTTDIAARLKISPRRVRAIAQSRGLKPLRVIGNVPFWAEDQVRAFKPGKSGRPRKTA